MKDISNYIKNIDKIKIGLFYFINDKIHYLIAFDDKNIYTILISDHLYNLIKHNKIFLNMYDKWFNYFKNSIRFDKYVEMILKNYYNIDVKIEKIIKTTKISNIKQIYLIDNFYFL